MLCPIFFFCVGIDELRVDSSNYAIASSKDGVVVERRQQVIRHTGRENKGVVINVWAADVKDVEVDV